MMARYISFAVLLAIIVVIGALFYKVMVGFFVPVFLAVVLVVVFRPLHRWVCAKVGQREHVAAGITTTLIVLIVLIPAALVLSMAAIQGAGLFQNFNSSIKVGLEKLRSNSLLNLEFPQAKQVQDIQQNLDEIQALLSSKQSYDELVSKKGEFIGDVQKIQKLLDDLIPNMVNSSKSSLLRLILKERQKSSKETIQKLPAQLESDLEPFFFRARQDLAALISMQDGMSEEDFRQELERVKLDLPLSSNDSPSIDPERAAYDAAKKKLLGQLSSSEQAMVLDARQKMLQNGIDWHNAIQATKEPLELLAAPEKASAEPSVAQLQLSALELSDQWRKARETISGGPWLAVLKDLANPSEKDLSDINQNFLAYLRPRLLTFTGDSAVFLLRFLVASSILLLSLYFFLYDGPGMVRTLMELSPLDDKYELELLAEFDRISRAIVLATVLSALLQGLVAGVGYYFVGMPSLILLTALTATCALVPFVGPAIVWAPVCVYLAVYEENFIAAGLLALWGMLVVGTVDNLVKVFVLHGQSQLHPLLALLSVLGGIQSLGPIGILVGPMVVVLLQTLLGILRTELSHFRRTEAGPIPFSTDAAVATDAGSLSGLIRKVKPQPTGEIALGPASTNASTTETAT